MAVINAFVTQNVSSVAVDKDVAARFGGAPVKKVLFSFEKAAGDNDASIFRIARISPYAKIVSLKVAFDAASGLTDVDAGFYKPLEVGGTEIDKDCLNDGLDPHTGQTAVVELFVPAIANIGREAHLIAGVTVANAIKYGAFDVAITGNVIGATAFTVAGVLEYIE